MLQHYHYLNSHYKHAVLQCCELWLRTGSVKLSIPVNDIITDRKPVLQLLPGHLGFLPHRDDMLHRLSRNLACPLRHASQICRVLAPKKNTKNLEFANSFSPSYLVPFEVIADYLSHFCYWQGYLSLMPLFGVNHKLRVTKFGNRKLKTWLYRMVWKVFWYLSTCSIDSFISVPLRLWNMCWLTL